MIMKAVAVFPGITGHFPIDAYAWQLLDAPAEAIKNVIALS
jgi:hypothetical protein